VALASDYNPGTVPVPGLQLTLLTAASSLKMTSPEVLCACTYSGAAALGQEAKLGVLLPGRCADLLLWGATPSQHSNHGLEVLEEIIVQCLQPSAVFVGGRLAYAPGPSQA
jgi:imidazolonepropionase-like amidohydrolase